MTTDLTKDDLDQIHAVTAEIGTIFTWDYERSRLPLMKLYEKAKTSQWNASTDLDWSIDVDPEKVADELGQGGTAALPGAGGGRGFAGQALRRQGVAPGRRRAAELAAVAVHARRAGRAVVHRAHRRDRAVDRRQVLRGDPGRRRGPPRRGVRALPRRQARHAVRHQREPQGDPRRHPLRPALGHRVPRHADHGRGARARGLRVDAADHDRAAVEEAAALRHERRGAPRRVRRALAAGVLQGAHRRRAARAPGVRVRRRARGCSAGSRTPRCGRAWASTPTRSTRRWTR